MNVNHTEDVLILAIESSCDETAASVVKKRAYSAVQCDFLSDSNPSVYGGWCRRLPPETY